MTDTPPPVPEMHPQPLMVHTPDLREGDLLVNANGLILAGPPGDEPDSDGYRLVPVVGITEPVRFHTDAAWLVIRP